jgi:hypothetical protein
MPVGTHEAMHDVGLNPSTMNAGPQFAFIPDGINHKLRKI